MEVAPENWIGVGGPLGRKFRWFTDRYPFVCHGLSLSLGGPSPLDEHFLQRLKRFLDDHRIRLYTEHLSYCGDDGHLYDLMPIPFTQEAVEYTAERIRRTQDILERRIAVENVSYYAAPGKEMDEIEFVTAVLEQADCDLLLDVNNIYVNSINHRYDPLDFLLALRERQLYDDAPEPDLPGLVPPGRDGAVPGPDLGADTGARPGGGVLPRVTLPPAVRDVERLIDGILRPGERAAAPAAVPAAVRH